MLFPRRKWKDIEGYEGIYQVSNLGEVRSLDRYVMNTKGRERFYKGRFLKPHPNNDGYFHVILSNHSKSKDYFIHRLVAIHFVDGYFEGAVVNHKDENKQNNIWTNLEFCTQKENTNYGTAQERRVKTFKKGKNNPNHI